MSLSNDRLGLRCTGPTTDHCHQSLSTLSCWSSCTTVFRGQKRFVHTCTLLSQPFHSCWKSQTLFHHNKHHPADLATPLLSEVRCRYSITTNNHPSDLATPLLSEVRCRYSITTNTILLTWPLHCCQKLDVDTPSQQTTILLTWPPLVWVHHRCLLH